MSAIASRPVPSLPTKVPASLRAVIERCLAKEPDARYERASEVRDALEVARAGAAAASFSKWRHTRFPGRLRGALVAMLALGLVASLIGLSIGGFFGDGVGVSDDTQVRSLAVLPLENLTGDPDQAFFADGIHDALITDLATLSDSLRVTARPSVLSYRNGEQALSEIAAALGVDAVMTGSVMRAGDRVQITAQLIDANTEEFLWAERYERATENVLTMQNEIVTAIANAIEPRLAADAAERLRAVPVVDPEAYEAYLRGRSYAKRFTPEDLTTALQYYEHALEEDPGYALAYVGISDVWGRRVVAGVVPALEGGPLWKEAAEQAARLDPTLAEAHGQLANVRTWVDWDWEGAETAFQQAIELNPNYASARMFYAHFLTALGRADEAEPHIVRALELDPLVAFNYAMRGVQLMFARRYDDALVAFDEAFSIDPNLGFGREPMWFVRALLGEPAEALASAREDYAGRGDTAAVEALDAGAAEGGYEGAMGRLAEVLAARPEATIRPHLVATYFADAGQVDRTFEWLERAVEARDIDMVYVGVDPTFRHEAVRRDPRFTDLLRRMNLPQ